MTPRYTFGSDEHAYIEMNGEIFLNVIEEENFCARANKHGSHLCQRREPIRQITPEMIDTRGPGFTVAAGFNTSEGSPSSIEFTQKIHIEALDTPENSIAATRENLEC
jgi:4-aminobutyrate aminotransferase-like enzyme